MPEHDDRSPFASATVPRHLARGAIGFTLIGAAFALAASVSPAALLLLLPGGVALRGCPTCWTVGLLQTISAGRLARSCGAAAGARFGEPCPPQRKRCASRT